MAKKEDKQKFGDIVENHELIKRTLMVAAFPALIKGVTKDGEQSFEGFLPGFEFAEIEDVSTEEELVEMLQDMLDDEVEELVVFGKSLPFVDEDEVLLEKYPEHKIVYLDINVYATKEELDYYDNCTHDCSSCGHHCHDEDCDCCDDDDCDCGCHDHDDCDCCDDECDDDCDCGCHEHTDCGCDEECDCGCQEGKECTCGDECNCGCLDGEECTCGDDCNCHEHHHNHKDTCKHNNCNCGENPKAKKNNKK